MFRAVPSGLFPGSHSNSRVEDSIPGVETARGLKDVVAIMANSARHNKVELFPLRLSRTRYTTIQGSGVSTNSRLPCKRPWRPRLGTSAASFEGLQNGGSGSRGGIRIVPPDVPDDSL